MPRPACHIGLRCAARWAAALIVWLGGAGPWFSGGLIAEESVGRFPPARIVSAPQVSEPAAPISEMPLLVDGPIAGRYGWPDGPSAPLEEPHNAAPPCDCPDCKGDGHGGQCGWPSGFSGWNAEGDYFSHNNPDDPARHVGKGEPLFGTSWLNRPHYTSVMLGGVITAGPLHPWAEHENSTLLSLSQGYDFDHYWGGEIRLAVGRWGLAASDRENNVWYVDAHLSYYPWGDARWRPYLSTGLGFMNNDFVDSRALDFHELLLTIPLSCGLKYQMQPHCAIRFDLTQNISLSTGDLETMDNISLSAGLEWHYGGVRKVYFPWDRQ